MTKVPNLSYDRVVRALQRCGWVVVRQHGSHIRLQKHADEKTLNHRAGASAHQTLPARAHSEAGQLSVDEFLALV